MRSAVQNEAYFEEPDQRTAPITVVGPLAWVRDNLFGSTLDSLLTVLGTLLSLFVITSLLQWSIGGANWYTVIFNLRVFLIGRVEPFMDLRLSLLAFYLALVVGVNFAAWSVVRSRVWLTLAAGLAALFIIPTLIAIFIPLPPMHLAAGQSEVQSGSLTVQPQPQVAFIGGGGEEISLQLSEYGGDDQLANITSFSDVLTNTLRNAAANRLAAQQRRDDIREELAGDRLTARQRAAHEAELAKTEIIPPIFSTHQVNTAPVNLLLRAASDGRELASKTIGVGAELRYTLPETGWYILEKNTVNDESIAILATTGIYPIFDRNFIRDGARVYQFTRATDRLLVEGGRPRNENGQDLPMFGIIEHQFRGLRSPSEFLRLMLAPFLEQVNLGLAVLAAFVAAGYFGVPRLLRLWLRRRGQEQEILSGQLRRLAIWLWLILLPLAFLLIVGIGAGGALPASDPQLWGGLLLTMMLTAVGIVAAFPIGIALALGRRSSLPIIRITSTMYIEVIRGVPLITLLFMSLLLVPFVLPSLGGPDSAPYRAMVAVTLFSAAYLAENVRGGLQGLPPGQEEAGKALGLPPWQITLRITLPQALRAVIPALVGQFISLYKDTALVAIVGLIDLTGVATGIASQTEFQGLRREPFLFIATLYFLFSFVMSLVSRRIEASGAGAARRE